MSARHDPRQFDFGTASSSAAVGRADWPIDETCPLVLPPLFSRDRTARRQDSPASAEFSGSVSAEAGKFSELVPPPACPLLPPAAGHSSPGGPAAPLLEGYSLLHALEPIIAERRRQIEEFGHTPDKDLTLRPSVLPDRAIRYLVSVHEDLQFRRGDFIANARRHAAQAGAMVAAIIDWLDAGGGR